MARYNGGLSNQHQAIANNSGNRQVMRINNNNNPRQMAKNMNHNRNQQNHQTQKIKPCRYGLQCKGLANGRCTFGHPVKGNVDHANSKGHDNHYFRNHELCPKGSTCFAARRGLCPLFHSQVENLGTAQVWEFGEHHAPNPFDSHVNQEMPSHQLILDAVNAFGTRPCCARYPGGVLLDEDGDVVMCDCTSNILLSACFQDWYLRTRESQRQVMRDHEQLLQELSEYKLNNPNSWSKEEAFQRMSVELRNYVGTKYSEHMSRAA